MPRSDANLHARLRYAQPPDLGPACRSVPRVDVLTTQDERVGVFDGLLLSPESNAPRYLVFRQGGDDGPRRLIPIASAWFDQTAEAIRVDDEDVQNASDFDPDAYEQMTPQEALEFEYRVLATCCPEVVRGAGPPKYDDSTRFQCPDWLKA